MLSSKRRAASVALSPWPIWSASTRQWIYQLVDEQYSVRTAQLFLLHDAHEVLQAAQACLTILALKISWCDQFANRHRKHSAWPKGQLQVARSRHLLRRHLFQAKRWSDWRSFDVPRVMRTLHDGSESPPSFQSILVASGLPRTRTSSMPYSNWVWYIEYSEVEWPLGHRQGIATRLWTERLH